MRRGELYYLRRRDVDLENGKINIKPYDGFSTKSRRLRSVPISANLQKYLQGLKRKHNSEYACRPYPDEHGLRKAFVRLLEEIGLRGTLHDLRHTFASHLAMNGVPIPVIKELLGHADITTTMIYAHLSPDTHKAAIDKLPF